MADWPDAEELKQVVNVVSDDWDTTLDRVLAAAIARVKQDVGEWDEDTDEPTDSLAQAALRMATLISEQPTAPVPTLAKDPTYKTLLMGGKKAWGIA